MPPLFTPRFPPSARAVPPSTVHTRHYTNFESFRFAIGANLCLYFLLPSATGISLLPGGSRSVARNFSFNYSPASISPCRYFLSPTPSLNPRISSRFAPRPRRA
ncbi:unnamed protein product [Sphacelaria rigidula]